MYSIEMLIQTRTLIEQAVAGLSQQELLHIPPSFDNNIVWNLSHLIVVQQLLHYRLSGLEAAVSNKQIAMFKTGTSPAEWQTVPDVATLLPLLPELPQKLRRDYQQGKFSEFQPSPVPASISKLSKTLSPSIIFTKGFILDSFWRYEI